MPFKILRIYNVWLLHYPFEALVNAYYSNSDERHRFIVTYACSTICRILLLLHFLAILWIWIGTEAFIDFEAGYTPWLLNSSDFADYTLTQTYVFAVYWVCTVVTTVGYGDYSGGTTLELLFTIGLEFFGFFIFAVL